MSSELRTKQNVSETRVSNSVQVDLDGRFMLPSGEEYPCKIVEMSTGRILFSTPVKPDLGDKIIVYLKELGGFEGFVERLSPTGFAIGMKLSETKHKKLDEQLMWLANHDALDIDERRRHLRIVPLLRLTTVRLRNGKEHIAKINDISRSGVNVEANVALPNVTLLIGSQVVVGTKAATINRLFEGGFVAEFIEPFPDSELNEFIRL